MDALILAGGLGTRLRSVVADRAKPVADVGDRPFVIWMMRHVARSARISRFIVCTGHLAKSVRDGLGREVAGVPVEYSEEDQPLGTGGALRLALDSFACKGTVLALNGDSHVGVDIARMMAQFRPASADFMLALARVDSTARYGRVELNGSRVVHFSEKGVDGAGWINAGVYLFSSDGCRRLLAAPKICSLERDVLPSALAAGRVQGYRSRAGFIDIGIPEDYRRAQQLFGHRRVA